MLQSHLYHAYDRTFTGTDIALPLLTLESLSKFCSQTVSIITDDMKKFIECITMMNVFNCFPTTTALSEEAPLKRVFEGDEWSAWKSLVESVRNCKEPVAFVTGRDGTGGKGSGNLKR